MIGIFLLVWWYQHMKYPSGCSIQNYFLILACNMNKLWSREKWAVESLIHESYYYMDIQWIYKLIFFTIPVPLIQKQNGINISTEIQELYTAVIIMLNLWFTITGLYDSYLCCIWNLLSSPSIAASFYVWGFPYHCPGWGLMMGSQRSAHSWGGVQCGYWTPMEWAYNSCMSEFIFTNKTKIHNYIFDKLSTMTEHRLKPPHVT